WRDRTAYHALVAKPGGLIVAGSAFGLAADHVREARHAENLFARRPPGNNRLFFRLAGNVAEKSVGGVKRAGWRILEVRRAFSHFDRHIDGIGKAGLGLIPSHIG